MVKKTLLELVQTILNDMDSDEVNDIDDTVESQQVASIIETCYYEMIANRNWPHTQKLIQLEASGDITKPNYLKLPENLKEMVFFKYDKVKFGDTRNQLFEVRFVYPDEFLRLTSGRNSTDTRVDVITDFGGAELMINNNQPPSYWTTFDDNYLVTDSYDGAVDSTLQRSKTQALAYLIPEWDRSNEAVPDLPAEAFPALLAEATSTAFFVLKQMANQKAEQKAARQQRWLARKAWRAQGGVRYDNYGRKR